MECRAERVRGSTGGGVENGGFAKMQPVDLPISRFLGPYHARSAPRRSLEGRRNRSYLTNYGIQTFIFDC